MAIGTGAAIVGSAIIGGIAQNSAAKKAAKAQTAAADKANELIQPYVEGGYQSNSKLLQLLGLNGGVPQTELESIPGYTFTRDQGLKNLNNSYGARGLIKSGAAMKGASRYVTGLADTTYGNQFNRLLETSKIGQNAAVGAGSNTIGAGNAQGAAAIAGGNAVANTASSVPSALLTNNLINGMYGQQGSGTRWLNPDTGSYV